MTLSLTHLMGRSWRRHGPRAVPAAAAGVVPSDRVVTNWASAGVSLAGGIPSRPTFTTLEPSGGIDGPAIQSALNSCPSGQAVVLSAGTFKIRDNAYVLVPSHVTLKGAGAGVTTLQSVRADGTTPGAYRDPVTGYIVDHYNPVVIVGPTRFPHWLPSGSAIAFTSDCVQGTTSATVATTAGLSVGQFVTVDEDQFFSASYQSKPDQGGAPNAHQVWKSDRITWARHNPTRVGADDFDTSTYDAYGASGEQPNNPLGWWSRGGGRVLGEVKEIAAIDAGTNTVTFTSPFTITYRSAAPYNAQLCGADATHTVHAGVESMTIANGSNGGLHFLAAAHCWAKNVDIVEWQGHGVEFAMAHRCEFRDSYVHYAAWPVPGGGGYAVSLSFNSTECLIENCIMLDANKCIVSNAAGAGCVVAYNYMTDAQIWDGTSATAWQEVHLNGSHFSGPHHMLFEGNHAANADSDFTHGASIYHYHFRNHLTGSRRTFTDGSNERCYGLGYGSYWMSFVANVLGEAGQMAGWTYDAGTSFVGDNKNVRQLGYDPTAWDQEADPQVLATVLEADNYEFLTNVVRNPSGQGLPTSMFRTSKPAFMGANPWPWVDPLTGSTYTLPAKARYDAGTPNVVL